MRLDSIQLLIAHAIPHSTMARAPIALPTFFACVLFNAQASEKVNVLLGNLLTI